jgi:uroporphyrin-III C-methyltransferase
MEKIMTEPTSSEQPDQHSTESSEAAASKANAEQVASAAAKATKQVNLANAAAANPPPSTVNKSTAKTEPAHKQPAKQSKIGWFAFVVAILAMAGSTALFYWQQQQHTQLSQLLQQKTAQQLTSFQQQTQQHSEQLLRQQMSEASQTLQQHWQQALQISEQRTALQQQQLLEQVQQQLQQLTQRQPSDWQLLEVEYLLRVAGRSLWLEKNPQVAMSLLDEANQRLQQLNDVKFLSLRQAINDDLTQLQMLPTLDTEQLLLSLNALTKQVEQLPLAQVQLPSSVNAPDELTLTSNIADWRTNLAKVWQRFINDFITIRRRTNDIEPLLAPQQQQQLRENITLKLQQAQWAVSQQQTMLYQQVMADIEAWLLAYFEQSSTITQQFINRLQHLSQQPVMLALPKQLTAITALQSLHIDASPRKQPATQITPSDEDKS